MHKIFRGKNPLCALALLLLAPVYYYGPAAIRFFQMKSYVKDRPELWLVPQPLSLDDRATVARKNLSYLGVSFSSPWPDLKPLRQDGNTAVLVSQNARSIVVFGPSVMTSITKSLRATDKSGAMDNTLGRDAMSSDFELKRQTLNTTPADLHFSLRPETTIRACTYLLVKSGEASISKTGIYQFSETNIRGFQIGDPERSGSVVIDAFNPSDQHAMIIVATVKNAQTRLTQAEVNTILASINIEENPSPRR